MRELLLSTALGVMLGIMAKYQEPKKTKLSLSGDSDMAKLTDEEE